MWQILPILSRAGRIRFSSRLTPLSVRKALNFIFVSGVGIEGLRRCEEVGWWGG